MLEVDFLHSFDLTQDGKYLLTFAGDALAVWTRDGQKVREFALEVENTWGVNPAVLSPDGSLLAVQRPRGQVVGQDKLDVYRVSDGTLLDTVWGMGAVFSPDRQYLATVLYLSFIRSIQDYLLPMAQRVSSEFGRYYWKVLL